MPSGADVVANPAVNSSVVLSGVDYTGEDEGGDQLKFEARKKGKESNAPKSTMGSVEATQGTHLAAEVSAKAG